MEPKWTPWNSELSDWLRLHEGLQSVKEQQALTFNLYKVTWPSGQRRINYIYKKVSLLFLASSKHRTRPRLGNTEISNNNLSVHNSIRETHQENNIHHNIQNNIYFFHLKKHFVQKSSTETEPLNHHQQDPHEEGLFPLEKSTSAPSNHWIQFQYPGKMNHGVLDQVLNSTGRWGFSPVQVVVPFRPSPSLPNPTLKTWTFYIQLQRNKNKQKNLSESCRNQTSLAHQFTSSWIRF